MPYLIQGTAEQLCRTFNQSWMISKGAAFNDLEKDFYRTKFFGSLEQAEYHIKKWKASTQDQCQYYSQGNMCAGNLFLLLNPDNLSFPLIQEDDPLEHYKSQEVRIDFAYVNKSQELCGLTLLYRKDVPSQWMVGLIKNTNLVPKDRTVILLTGFDLKPRMKLLNDGLVSLHTDSLTNELVNHIDSDVLTELLKNALKSPLGEIDVRCNRLELVLRFLTDNKSTGVISDPVCMDTINPDSLFAENRALDLVVQNELQLSSAMTNELLSEPKGLRNEIERIQFTKESKINKQLLKMTVAFYEEQVLLEHRDFLQQHVFSKVLINSAWNDIQIRLIPFLIKKEYDLATFQLILSEPAYYTAIDFFKERGLTQNVVKFLREPAKLEQLKFIYGLKLESQKKLCWVFWAKSDMLQNEYDSIVSATNKRPLFIDSLLAKDQDKIISFEDLKTHALDPMRYQAAYIKYHFASLFKQFHLNKSQLDKLDSLELDAVVNSFNILQQAKINLLGHYILALDTSKEGLLFRLFLPLVTQIQNDAYRAELINVLYIGINKGLASQRNAVERIVDKELLVLAQGLVDRFICAQQLQKLDFKRDVIVFVSQEGNKNAAKFRDLIFRVEKLCKEVHERLIQSSPKKGIIEQWQLADKEYRKTIYEIIYDEFQQSSPDLKKKLNMAEKQILLIVDPVVASWLRQTLVIIANIVITALSLGFANVIKYNITGNAWFFNQTRSGEEIRALDNQIFDLGSHCARDPK